MKTVAIIQARMGSTRLPGKVMLPLAGRSVLSHVISRVNACSLVDEVVVATTVHGQDDTIAGEAANCGAGCFRGSEDDVLDRYCRAAQESSAGIVVRITSDCPLMDPAVLGSMLERFARLRDDGVKVDYLSNTITRTYPRGLDAEIFTAPALARAGREATLPAEREHVTPYIRHHPELFTLFPFTEGPGDGSSRWTLDTEDDYRFIQVVFEELYREGEAFGMEDVLALLKENPDLTLINAHVRQKTAF